MNTDDEKAQAIDYLKRIIFDCEQHLALGEDNPTANNHVVALYRDGTPDLYLHIVDRLTSEYNFAANALNTPRYQLDQAEQIASNIRSERSTLDVRAVSDPEAVAAELQNARRILTQLQSDLS